MGRSSRQVYNTKYGATDLPKDRGEPGTTEESLSRFAERSQGPVAAQLWERRLVTFDAKGNVVVDRERVRAEVKAIEAEVVSSREYPREQMERMAAESTELPPRQAMNAEQRTMQARAKAVLAAAKAGGVAISPAEKRILNPIAEGRYWQTVYGKKGQHEGGTLATRVRARRGSGRSRDSGYQARAREMRETFREYRGMAA